MTRRLFVLVVVAVLVLGPSAAVAEPVAGSDAPSIEDGTNATTAPSGSVTIDRAVSDDTADETLTFTFEATGNGTVSVEDLPQSSDSNAEFEFVGWQNQNTGQSGSSSSWTATDGDTYEVEYRATVSNGANGGTNGDVTASTSIDGPASRSQQDLSVYVEYLDPEFGYIGPQSAELVYDGSGTATTDVSVDIPNDGPGVLVPSEMDFQNVPNGMTVESDSLPDSIDPGSSGAAGLSIEADDSLAEGTYTFDVVVDDNLDSVDATTFQMTVDVQRVPVVGLPDTIDVGDVLVDSSGETSFDVSEEAGYEPISGASATVTGQEPEASLSLDGLSSLYASPGGSDSATAFVSVQGDVGQHEELSWTVEVSPDSTNGVADTADVSARVIYEAYFGSVDLSDTELVFDESREDRTSFTRDVTLDVPNDGDIPMDVQGVSATANHPDVSASVASAPTTISGQEIGEVDVEFTASTDAPETDVPVEITVDATDAGTETVSSTLSIEHETAVELEETSLTYGDLIITESATRSTDVSEALGYQDATGVTVERVSGPDEWLEVVERPPENIDAGSSSAFVVETQFTPDATPFQEYTWEFRLDGDNVESRNITVTARAEPISFDSIREPLTEHTDGDAWQSDVSTGMVSALDTLESKLRENESISRGDLPSTVAAARSTTLFVNSVDDARETIQTEGHMNASGMVVRAAAAHNLMSEYVGDISGSDVQTNAEASLTAADEELEGLLDEQMAAYDERLAAENTTAIQRANIQREVARIASLRGEEERASTLSSEAEAAYEEYVSLVETGSDHRVEASTTYDEMSGSSLHYVAGQPLLVNPMNWDSFNANADHVVSNFEESAEAYEIAGATAQADEVRDRLDQAEQEFQFARYTFYASSAIYLVVFLGGALMIARNLVAYVQDARAAATGEFLA